MSSTKVNRSGLMVDMKAVLRELHQNDLVDVSIGDAFAALLRAGSRNGVHNPGDFFLLTRAFVIMESMMRQLDPQFDFMEAFREEIKRMTAQHFTLEQLKDKTGKLARELERLITDGPGDARRVLRRIADGNLGRIETPAVESLVGRVSRDIKRLTDAIAAAALLIGGTMLVNAQPDSHDWHRIFGEAMVFAGAISTVLVGIAALRRDRSRGRGRPEV